MRYLTKPFCVILFCLSGLLFSQDTLKVKTLNEFLDGIGYRESRNNYSITSKSGYLGKYQFHPRTLKAIGVTESKKTFLNNKNIQDHAMIKLLKVNKEYLKKEIERYSGKVINGVMITESGILAAAHLGGYGNVKKYLNKGIEFMDGNGTKISNYIRKFSGFVLELETK